MHRHQPERNNRRRLWTMSQLPSRVPRTYNHCFRLQLLEEKARFGDVSFSALTRPETIDNGKSGQRLPAQ